MGRGKDWTDEEIEYLESSWGVTTMPGIAKKLGRSVQGVRQKAYAIGLSRFMDNGSYVTLHQLLLALGLKSSYSYLNMKLKNRGLPIRYKTAIRKRYKIVYLNEFWKWAKENQTHLNFSKFEENMLGPEENWVKVKRYNDSKIKRTVNVTPWTEKEDRILEDLINKQKYNYTEIARRLRRSEGAVTRRINDLGLKGRPLREAPHNVWTKEQLETLKEMLLKRSLYMDMADKIGKSEKAIRGKVYSLYGSENLDKAYSKMILLNEQEDK